MGKIQITEGYQKNNWKVIEANIINPDTKSKALKGKTCFSKCICTNCNKTTRYILNSFLRTGKGLSNQCNNCNLIERNEKNRQVQIGQIYGYLKVVGDGGYKITSSGKRRHCSLCECLNCGTKNVLALDNSLESGLKVSCGCLVSKGEKKIETLLKENNIYYKKEVVDDKLLEDTGRRLRFDFGVYDENQNLLRYIEFDGQQHIDGMVGGIWSQADNLEIRQERDNIKNEWCKKNNIVLIRIPYWQVDNITIQDILGEKYKI